MPHLHIEYTANLPDLDEQALMAALNQVVCSHPSVLHDSEVKARIHRIASFRIGTQPQDRAFVHVLLQLLEGRSEATRQELAQALGAVLRQQVPPRPGLHVQLSVDVAEMNRPCYYKHQG
ncbi:5-carboxymethyl-2-hydroxymuconate Delta-isomerase [Comamonas nitrativorans]|uniref:5-carboxymethyl-2-hydroxymuconate Delta-isomerase n=1 Tax=Comamonas nitrativorans TaxID=108437 RepID=A0ABV9GRV7_9BURK